MKIVIFQLNGGRKQSVNRCLCCRRERFLANHLARSFGFHVRLRKVYTPHGRLLRNVGKWLDGWLHAFLGRLANGLSNSLLLLLRARHLLLLARLLPRSNDRWSVAEADVRIRGQGTLLAFCRCPILPEPGFEPSGFARGFVDKVWESHNPTADKIEQVRVAT